MKTNDIKKGVRILLDNGWYATMADNMRGNRRMATVEGFHTETGSVYSHDIVKVKAESMSGGLWLTVEHTPAQDKLRQQVKAMGL